MARRTLRNRNRNRKTLRNRKTIRTHNRNRKTLRNRKILRIRGGNTTDAVHTTTDDTFDIPTIEDAYVSIPGATIPVKELKEYMESRAQEAY